MRSCFDAQAGLRLLDTSLPSSWIYRHVPLYPGVRILEGKMYTTFCWVLWVSQGQVIFMFMQLTYLYTLDLWIDTFMFLSALLFYITT